MLCGFALCAKLHCCSLTWALLTVTSAKPHVTTPRTRPRRWSRGACRSSARRARRPRSTRRRRRAPRQRAACRAPPLGLARLWLAPCRPRPIRQRRRPGPGRPPRPRPLPPPRRACRGGGCWRRAWAWAASGARGGAGGTGVRQATVPPPARCPHRLAPHSRTNTNTRTHTHTCTCQPRREREHEHARMHGGGGLGGTG